jgi:hypothetical protein
MPKLWSFGAFFPSFGKLRQEKSGRPAQKALLSILFFIPEIYPCEPSAAPNFGRARARTRRQGDRMVLR